ncbi:tetratricopeptide repeat protein 21B isoform X2 [Triplophysa dalaica]|uniref:tetratricopeptide repeat protein 21B isoform X2 n=1 Tax=Triplophysa dalaica TaxID=1582913 RepID=UPI0024DFC2EF|nr:tetratricopeptide repeat protein 21B isoform X2 [Triplophysa dalaica]
MFVIRLGNMAENDATCLPLIIYYMREKYFRHAINTAEKYLQLYNNDPVLRFIKAVGSLMEGDMQEAMRDLIHLKDQPHLSLCSTIALINAHRRRETLDEEALNTLTSDLKLLGSTAGVRELYYTALLYWILDRNVKARICINKMLKLSDKSPQGLVLKAWIILTSEVAENKPQAIRYFDSTGQDSENVFGLMGKVEFLMAKQKQPCALDIVNQIIVSHPDFVPGLNLKMRIFMSLRDWEQTEELARRILERDDQDLKALQMMAVIAAAKDGDMGLVKKHLQSIINAVEITEPNNSSLHAEIAAPISRLCGHNTEILQMLTVFMRRVSSRSPVASDVMCELGYLLALQNMYKEAHECYSTALKTDDKTPTASVGLITCLLMCDQLEEAIQQLAAFCEAQESLGNIAEVLLLKAVSLRKQRGDEETVVQLLKDATELHFSALHGLSYSVEYLRFLDVNFLLQIVQMHMELNQDLDPGVPGKTQALWLKHSYLILERIIRAAPGISASCYLMAYVKFLQGDVRGAQGLLDVCVERGFRTVEVCLLQAGLQLHTGDHSTALNSLQSAVSFNFQIIDQIQFNLMKARALVRSGDLKSAIQCLNITMNTPGVRQASEGSQSSVSIRERVCVYLELTEALRLDGDQHAAAEVLQEAILRFKGTSEETRVTLVSVDLALMRNDVDAAVVILQNILPHESIYIQAREKLAHIYLERKNNKKLYIACYREISEQLPGAHNSVLLADAFMNIQQPEEALKIYQEAQRTSPEDTALAMKTSRAFVKAHEYDKAVSCYERALKVEAQDCVLSLELADLLFKRQEFEKAQRLLQKALEHEHASSLDVMMNDVKMLRVLVKVQRVMDESALDAVQKARDLQQKIVNRVRKEQPVQLEDQMKLLADIYCEGAHEFHLGLDLEMARHHYTDALNYSPDNQEIILHLARFYYKRQKLDHCEEMCRQILKLHHHHTDASMLLADTLFWKNQKDEAVQMYADIMERYPACETFCPLSVREAAYNYCKGLYSWYVYEVREALIHLNKARGDCEWGERAVELMVQICLNPDKDVFGAEVLDKRRTNVSESENQTRISTAQNLLKMFCTRSRSEEQKVRLLQNLCLIYSKESRQMERAVLDLTDMLAKNMMSEACLLAAAQGFLQLKQIPRARNFLKRLTKMEWNDSNSDDLENASLLMADMYIKMGKYSQVDKLLQNSIRHNKSCSKAYEYQGFMMENEERYTDASLQYELAWKYTRMMDPAIGFRLAFNCLKCKNYTRAVDVCRQVLQHFPDYPQIQDEILTRAQASLRP